MALYIPHSIFHLARLLYVRPETFGPYYVYIFNCNITYRRRITDVILETAELRATRYQIINEMKTFWRRRNPNLFKYLETCNKTTDTYTTWLKQHLHSRRSGANRNSCKQEMSTHTVQVQKSTYTQQSTTLIRVPTHWILIGRSMTVPPLMLRTAAFFSPS